MSSKKSMKVFLNVSEIPRLGIFKDKLIRILDYITADHYGQFLF
jgi:hypothetical protein